MKTLHKITALILVTLLCFTVEAKDKKGKYTRKKEISNSYSVNSHFDLRVNNMYGEVRIETWDKEEVAYKINIISNGEDLKKVEDRLERIDVSQDESKSKLSLITHIKNGRNHEKSTFTAFVKSLFNGEAFSSGSNHIEINYIIQLPKHANLDITNDYGYIYIGETKGETRLNSDYGGIMAEALLSSSNVINMDYASKSDFNHVRQADMNIAYSSVNIEHAGFLNISADYSTTKIDQVKDIRFNVDYGSISVNTGRKVEGSADYVQVRIGEVEELLDVNLSYGGLKVNHIQEGFNYANIHSDYATVKVGIDYSEEFIVNARTDYANIKGTQDFTTIHKDDENYKGYNKNRDAKKFLTISADYGSVSIFPAN